MNAPLRKALPTPVPRRLARPIAALPALAPADLLPRSWGAPLAFPFCDPRTQYFYLGRGAVWHAMRLLGLQGEEVLVPAYHHGVEVEALVDAGVKVRFYGVDRQWKADLKSIAEQLTPNTRALYVIHYAGFPQPMDDLLAIARTRGLKVIEDCALSLLSSDGTRPLGCRSDAAIFCLYKTLPVPHGGALWMPQGFDGRRLESPGAASTLHQIASSLLVRMERTGGLGQRLRAAVRETAKAVRSMRPLPVDSKPVGRRTFVQGQESLDCSPVSLQIARGLDARQIVDQRRKNYYALASRLRDVAPPLLQELPAGACPLFYPVWVSDKKKVQAYLAQEGVEAIDFWSEGSPLVPAGQFPEVEALRRHVLELPIHQDLDADDMEALAGSMRRALASL